MRLFGKKRVYFTLAVRQDVTLGEMARILNGVAANLPPFAMYEDDFREVPDDVKRHLRVIP